MADATKPEPHVNDDEQAGGGRDALPPLPDSDLARSILGSPDRLDLWDEAEANAADAQRPEDVEALYLHVLARPIAPLGSEPEQGDGAPLAAELAMDLCQRAASFLAEWSEDSVSLVRVLSRALEIDPTADWAFRRLSMRLTIEHRWDELLSHYDKVLRAVTEPMARAALLSEAAQVAKDLAGRADRAITYLQDLSSLQPSDTQVVGSLERLLAREGRHRDLVDLQKSRLAGLDAAEARTLRLQIAGTLLDPLQSPAESLEALDGLLADPEARPAALEILKQIFATPSSSIEVRGAALAELRRAYDAANERAEMIDVLRVALRVAEANPAPAGGALDPRALHRELAERLVALGRDAESMDDWAALLVLEPTSDDARVSLRDLASKTGRPERYADALAAAGLRAAAGSDVLPAHASALLFEAGTVRADTLGDNAGAVRFFGRIFADGDRDAPFMLDVCRRLDALLDPASPERLAALERRATLEPDQGDRRPLWMEAASRADALGDPDRALRAYEEILAAHPSDTEAHEAVIAILEREGRSRDLVAALRRAAAAPGVRNDRSRPLRVRAAGVVEVGLGDAAAAVEAWGEIESLYGADEETIDALVRLLSAAQRWTDLIEVLERGLEETLDPTRRVEFLHGLAEVYRVHTASPERALVCYRTVLAEVPSHAGARAGLTALLSHARCQPVAVVLLLQAYDATGDWAGRLSLLEHRLAGAPDDAARTALLCEAADLHEQREQNPVAALRALARALPLAPNDTALEARLLALAEATDQAQVATDALARTIEACAPGARAADLHDRRGQLLATALGDRRGALEAHLAAFRMGPERRATAMSVVEAATQEGAWDDAARTIARSAAVLEEADAQLISAFETAAAERAGWGDATAAMESAVAAEAGLDAQVASTLWRQIAAWHRGARHDRDAAERALRRALAAGGDRVITLRELASLLRASAQEAPSPALVDTLLQLADAGDHVLDVLHEAALAALDGLGDRERGEEILMRLRGEVAGRLAASFDDTGALASLASFVTERLVTLAQDRGDHAAAADLLMDAARWPLGEEAAIQKLHAAARIAEEQMADLDRAASLYRAILERAPADRAAITRLGALYERTDAARDLLGLRQHELALATAPSEDAGDLVAEHVRLRLDIARLHGRLDDRPAEEAALRENLAESPGHAASLEQLVVRLKERGAERDLADLLETQGAEVLSGGDGKRAAGLFTRASEIQETSLGDAEHALALRQRAAEHEPTPETFDALARLATKLGDSNSAVKWLDRRLDTLPAGEDEARVDTIRRLSDALLSAGDPEAAEQRLAEGLSAHPGAVALAEPLAKLYRLGGAWESLVELQSGAAPGAPKPSIEHLREAADVCLRKLGSRERAIRILEALADAAPNDRGARLALADALRATGELDRSRAILGALLESYGRRKPPERAEVHLQLARIAMAAGDSGEARTQLETAISMNPEHPDVLRTLGGVYRDAGDLVRAERMFGALLLIALRQKPAAAEAGGPGRAEAMIQMHWVLSRLGQKGRAEEMLASAFEAAKAGAHEANRLEQALREAGDQALLLRALEARLQDPTTEGPARAAVLLETADLFTALDRHGEALDALLAALPHQMERPPIRPGASIPPSRALAGPMSIAPASAILNRAITAARAAGGAAIGRAADALVAAAERAERVGWPAGAGVVWIALGDLRERDLADAAGALDAYVRAESLGADSLPIWRAIDRAAGAANEPKAQIRVLRHLVFAGDDGDASRLTDDVFRLASLELASPDDMQAGLGTLDWALSREPRHAQAGALLRAASIAAPNDTAVLAAYERVARAADDPAMLLDALSRAGNGPGATMDLLREAVGLAERAGDGAAVQALLERAVELGEANTNGLGEAAWALVALADRAESSGDLRAAAEHLGRAAGAADRDEALRLVARAAEIAEKKLNDPRFAADLYERMLDRDRHDRDVWSPLLDLSRRLGDADLLATRLREAIDAAFDAAWRLELRRERALLLVGTDWESAAAELSEIISEDEEDAEAARTLTKLYEEHGRQTELAELLERRLSSAQMRGDNDAVIALSLDLGALLAGTSPERAIDVYTNALDRAPEHVELLRRLLALYVGEAHAVSRGDVLERLLALSTGQEAAERALALAEVRTSLGDEDGTAEALAKGLSVAPGHAEIKGRLAAFYRERERWADLAAMLAAEGAADPGPGGVAALREAASLYLDKLEQPTDAAQALARAAERAPTDLALLMELATCEAKAGQTEAARSRVATALSSAGMSRADRVALHRLRASMLTEPDELAQATADLEAAYLLDPSLATNLRDCLDRRRDTAEGGADRAVWMRLFDVLLSLGEVDRARDLLADWVAKEPDDVPALQMAAFADGLAGKWETAAERCDRIVDLVTGPGRVDAALLVADACVHTGFPEDARPVLEQVLRENAGEMRLHERLRAIYENAGAHRELAELHFAEATQAADANDRYAALRKAGQLYLEQVADPAAAIAPLEAAREIKPRDVELAAQLSDAYLGAGKLQEAANVLDTALQTQKGRRSREVSLLQHRMALVAAAVGDKNNEMGWLNAAIDSDGQNGEAAARLADVATELGQMEVALKALKAITLMKSPQPMGRAMAYLRQAMIAQYQGDARKAVLLAKKAQSEDPNLEEAKSLLAELGAG